MKNKIYCISLIFFYILFFSLLQNVEAKKEPQDIDKRTAIINQSLDRVLADKRAGQLSSGRIVGQPLPENIQKENPIHSEEEKKRARSSQPFSYNPPKTQFEISTGASFIQYEEPGIMKEEGLMYGIAGTVLYRTQMNDQASKPSEILAQMKRINIYKLEAEIAYGRVDYDSRTTGAISDISDLMFETRGLAGVDIPFSEKTLLTPYFGLGYRYLRDDTSGMVSTTGAHGYMRQSNYLYLPVGIDIRRQLGQTFALTANFECDWLLFGRQQSNLSDVSSAYQDIDNDQRHGFGLRSAFKLEKDAENYNLFIEPFARYWNIERSTLTSIQIGNMVLTGYEPKNTSTEYGVKLGANF